MWQSDFFYSHNFSRFLYIVAMLSVHHPFLWLMNIPFYWNTTVRFSRCQLRGTWALSPLAWIMPKAALLGSLLSISHSPSMPLSCWREPKKAKSEKATPLLNTPPQDPTVFRVKQSPHHSLSSPAQPDSLYMQSLSPPSPAHTGLAAEPQTCLSTFQLAFPTFFKPLLFQKGIFHCLVTLSFPTLIDTMDCSPPGSSVHGIFRQKYWSGLPFFSSKASSQPRDWTHVSWMSCIAGRFFTRWAIREAPRPVYISSERRILSISWTL